MCRGFCDNIPQKNDFKCKIVECNEGLLNDWGIKFKKCFKIIE